MSFPLMYGLFWEYLAEMQLFENLEYDFFLLLRKSPLKLPKWGS